MATMKVAINGFGRIGRCILRAALARKENIEFVAINDIDAPATMAHLFKYDSVHRTWPGQVSATDKSMTVDGRTIAFTAEKDPTKLPWKALGVDVVLECTGRFADREGASHHLAAGAKKVIISAPAKGPDVLDLTHKDLRRARAAAMSMIPTSTGAAKSIGEVLPALKGKMNGISVRVPTPNVSLVDLTVVLGRKATTEEINAAFRKAAEGALKGILEYSEAETVSVDYNGNPHSAIVDATNTFVIDGNLAKVLAWYDNEWGFSNRMVDLTKLVMSKG